MVQIQSLWAIIWPVIQGVIEKLRPDEQMASILICIIAMLVSRFLLERILPAKKVGNPLSEILHLYKGIVILASPLIVMYFILRDEYPVLTELVSFIFKIDGVRDSVIVWGKILLVAGVFFGLLRWVIHLASVMVQRAISVGSPLLVVPRFCEGVMRMVTLLWLPFFIISVAKTVDFLPLSFANPLAQPEGVDVRVWGHLVEGVKRAQANGVGCDIYLLYSLKEYETGSYLCTQADASRPRPNQCASYAGALGTLQFVPETFERNARRYGVTGSLWNSTVAAEVACYFIRDEVKISLEQSRREFGEEFSLDGFVWNRDLRGAGKVYDRAIALRKSAMDSIQKVQTPPLEYISDGYIWPAPAGSYVTFEWGVPMWYGNNHNGMDIVLPGFPPFEALAIDNGKARYWYGGSCNAGVITLQTSGGEQFHYVHMELDAGKINIPTNGEWTSVRKGEKLGWILNGKTYFQDGSVCSDGSHLHLMRVNGAKISQEEFKGVVRWK